MVLITRALIDQRKEHASPEAECPSLCGQFSVADCLVQTRDLDYLLGAVQVLRNFPDEERQKGGGGVNHVVCRLMLIPSCSLQATFFGFEKRDPSAWRPGNHTSKRLAKHRIAFSVGTSIISKRG